MNQEKALMSRKKYLLVSRSMWMILFSYAAENNLTIYKAVESVLDKGLKYAENPIIGDIFREIYENRSPNLRYVIRQSDKKYFVVSRQMHVSVGDFAQLHGLKLLEATRRLLGIGLYIIKRGDPRQRAGYVSGMKLHDALIDAYEKTHGKLEKGKAARVRREEKERFLREVIGVDGGQNHRPDDKHWQRLKQRYQARLKAAHHRIKDLEVQNALLTTAFVLICVGIKLQSEKQGDKESQYTGLNG